MAQLSSAREAEEASVNSKGDSASSVGRPEIIQPSGESVADHHGWVAPQPTALPAAVLLVDVSGFTRLSELYSSQGPAGCEDFSLLIAELFEKLTVVIEYFGGDIDCFAGDAVLVVFPVSSTDRLSSLRGDDAVAASKREATAAAARQALRCAEVVEGRLSGFQKAPDDPPLTVHSALAVGTIHSVICGKLALAQGHI
jgi:class 3 adenylate cyclase